MTRVEKSLGLKELRGVRSKITRDEGRVTGAESLPNMVMVLESGIFQLSAENVPSVVWVEVH